jgi:hypothetical protein
LSNAAKTALLSSIVTTMVAGFASAGGVKVGRCSIAAPSLRQLRS